MRWSAAAAARARHLCCAKLIFVGFFWFHPGNRSAQHPEGGQERVAGVLGGDVLAEAVGEALPPPVGALAGDGAERQAGSGAGMTLPLLLLMLLLLLLLYHVGFDVTAGCRV